MEINTGTLTSKKVEVVKIASSIFAIGYGFKKYSHEHFLDIIERLNIMIDIYSASALEYVCLIVINYFEIPYNLFYCDLKPSNFMLTEDLTVHVSDFGMSKLFGDKNSVTQTMTFNLAPVNDSSSLFNHFSRVFP